MRARLLLLSWLLLAAGCGEDFKPASAVLGFRVLGVRAEPPELHPGERAQLSALVADPRNGRAHTLLWLGCAPDPFAQGRSACSDIAAFQDSSAILQGGGGGELTLPPGMSIIGFGERAVYAADPQLFSVLDPADPRRQSGTVGQVLLLAVGGELSLTATPEERAAFFERVQSKELPFVFVLFRLRISEEPVLNANPVLGELRVDGEAQPPFGTVRLPADRVSALELTAPESAFEPYTQLNAQGEREEKTERLLTAWYADTGVLAEERVALGSEVGQRYTPPSGDEADPLPADRSGQLWVVARDTRGGQSWTERRFFLCDASASVPTVSGIEPAAGPANGTSLLTVRGQGLDGVLEVRVGGHPLSRARFNPQGATFEGLVPPLPPGPQAVQVVARRCDLPDINVSYDVTP